MPLPGFLVKKIPKLENMRKVRALINDEQVHTVCEEAKCPNIGECYASRTCTFIILGENCTRNCAFCGVSKGKCLPPDPAEPARIAEAVKKLGLAFVVITSVTRDDLPDGGAGHFASVSNFLLSTFYSLRLELLIPDFKGDMTALQTVLEAHPFVLNHNIETVPRLYPKIRPLADYARSLQVLERAKASGRVIYTKSGFMVGLGEQADEIRVVLADLKKVNCDIVTIGQYLPPSRSHLQPERYVAPAEFEEYKVWGQQLGLRVEAGPFVRSSYHAGEMINVKN